MDYKAPVPYDIKIGGEILKTIIFESMYVGIGDKRYRIGATEILPNGDCLHFMRNMETNVARDVTGAMIRTWIDR